jgi:anti-sigma regulatory factor (Ser/Thr protein kinase)
VSDEVVSLGLPADAASIAVVRAVVASVASKLALPYDAVDDLRIAAAEASTLLLTSGPAGSQLRVDLRPSSDDLRLTIWVTGVPSLAADGRGSLAWRVIEGLTDEVTENVIDGNHAIELRMRTVAS